MGVDRVLPEISGVRRAVLYTFFGGGRRPRSRKGVLLRVLLAPAGVHRAG